jgi:hypothetical protein
MEHNDTNGKWLIQDGCELDVIVPRVLEDMIEQGEFVLHESKLEVIARKKALRIQLQELEV